MCSRKLRPRTLIEFFLLGERLDDFRGRKRWRRRRFDTFDALHIVFGRRSERAGRIVLRESGGRERGNQKADDASGFPNAWAGSLGHIYLDAKGWRAAASPFASILTQRAAKKRGTGTLACPLGPPAREI